MLLINFKNKKLYPLKRQSSLPCVRKSPSERDDYPSIFGSKMYKNHPVHCYVYRTLRPTFPSHAHFLVLQLSIKLPLQNSWLAKFEIVCAFLLLIRSTQKSSPRHFALFFKDVWC